VTLQLVCLDPGFASVGYATLVFNTGAAPFVHEFGIIRTAKSDKKQKVLAVEDNLRRTMEIATKLRWLCTLHRTVGICAEAMSFPRSSSVAAKMALAWGAIASLSEAAMIPILQATPMQVKKAVTGVKTSTKDEVIEAVEKLYPEIVEKRATIPRGQWEHCHDAVAVGHLMLASDTVRMARLAG
jgi:crossover junction endodeoxyribonuclease RuvC